MTENEISHPKDFVRLYKTLETLAISASKFYNKALDFVNRELSPEFFMEHSYNFQYEAKVLAVPEVIVNIWTQNYAPGTKEAQEQIVESLEKCLNLTESKKIVVGRAKPHGDDALYTAWQMFPQVRNNLWLIAMQSVEYDSHNLIFFEGLIDAYLSAANVGRLPRGDFPEEMKKMSKEITSIDKKISFKDFGDLYRDVLNSGILRSGE